MTEPKLYTWDDLPILACKAAGRVSKRYGQYGITFDDCLSEANLWLYGHKNKVRGWLSARPQRTTRVYRSFYDAALSYAETEKSARVGYEVDDVAWYSETLVEGLMPLALDQTFTGETQVDDSSGGRKRSKPASEGGDLLAMVLDIRRAIKYVGQDPHNIVDYLGGNRPMIGRRKPMSNQVALAITQ